MKKYSKAESLYMEGYNCAQAVVCAHIDKYHIPEEYAFKFSASFGNGISGNGDFCGALSGLAMLIGIDLDHENPSKNNKNLTYQITHELSEIFKSKNNSVRCDYLKQRANGNELKPCTCYVADSNEIFEYYLLNKTNLINKYSSLS